MSWRFYYFLFRMHSICGYVLSQVSTFQLASDAIKESLSKGHGLWHHVCQWTSNIINPPNVYGAPIVLAWLNNNSKQQHYTRFLEGIYNIHSLCSSKIPTSFVLGDGSATRTSSITSALPIHFELILQWWHSLRPYFSVEAFFQMVHVSCLFPYFCFLGL